MKRYEVLFLDADETLFDFRKTEAQAFGHSFAEFGLVFSPEIFGAYEIINRALWKKLERGETTQERLKVERFELLFREVGIEVDPAVFCAVFVRWLGAGSFLLPGAQELCEYLGARYRLAIVTNGIAQVQRARFEASSIRRFVEAIVISEEVSCSKPGAEIFRHACEAMAFFNKAGILMIGDSLASDIQGGVNFGIDTCWLNPSGELRSGDPEPTYEVRSLEEIGRLL